MKRLLVFSVLVACALMSGDSESLAQPKQPPAKLLDETKFDIKRHARCMAFSPDGKTLAVAEDNVHLYTVGGEAPKEIAVLKARVGFGIRAIAFSPDGKKLAFGGSDNTVRVWDVETQRELFQAKDHKGDVRALAFSPDGKFLATGSNDKTTFLWEVTDEGKLIERAVIKAEDKFGSAVAAVVFAQKGKTLVTAGSNGTFRVFNLEKGVKQIGTFKGKGFNDVSIVSSPDGKLWGITDHKAVHLLTAQGVASGSLEGHKENVTDVAFSPDGKLLASAGRDGTLHVWNIVAKKPQITKDRPGRFSAVAWAPAEEGTTDMTLAAALEDGTVWVLKVGYDKK